jgi:hypothetical protein
LFLTNAHLPEPLLKETVEFERREAEAFLAWRLQQMQTAGDKQVRRY